jgi:AcrR family transcriptional regulator
MSPLETVAVSRFGAADRTAAQTRVIVAALDLFADRGVSATSLQMIADAVGVTKAAVYHQFKTKEEIVVAAVELELVRLEPALDAAEAAEPGRRSVETFLAQVIDLAVERRRMVNTLQTDPVILRLLVEHEPFQRFMGRLYRLLMGGRTSARARVQAAMISAALGGAVTHPLVADIDDAALRRHLLGLTRQFLDLPS